MQNAFIAPLGVLQHPHRSLSQVSMRRHARLTASRSTRSTVRAAADGARSVEFTPLGNNTFILEGNGTRLLVDPFLEEELVFFSPAFFRLAKDAAVRGISRAGRIDAVVLTQHLPDHAHEPTLRCIDRATPVIAPAKAEALLSKLGFHNVSLLRAGETVTPVPDTPGVTVTAGAGSVLGPPGSEPQLALVFSFGTTDSAPLSVYHEPHGYHSNNFLREHIGIDAAIAPVVRTSIPALRYSLVNGASEAVELCKQLRPKALVGFDNSGGESSGFLKSLISQNGDIDELREAVQSEAELFGMKIMYPQDLNRPVVIASTADELVSAEIRT